MSIDTQSIADAFRQVAELTDAQMVPKDLRVEELPAPHRPTGLPPGSMAVYVFSYNCTALKVGKAGPNSDARFRGQHYNPRSAASTLAASILKYPAPVGNPALDVESVGDWIRENTDRVNFILSEHVGIDVLTLLESFIQCRLKPVYEGFQSQRRGI